MRLLFILLIINITFITNAQDLIISEVVASNATGYLDPNYETSDWIELQNISNNSVSLSDYFLSNSFQTPKMWQLPATTLAPGAFIIVYANCEVQKNEPASPFFLETVLNIGDQMTYLTPQSEPDLSWNTVGFDDSDWNSGVNSFGFGDDDDSTIISTSYSVYLRKEFEIENINQINDCFLHMDFDDGFVAYINGTEIARSNIGTPGIPPGFDEFATSHEAVMYTGILPPKFTISNFQSILHNGTNVIAIQVHNTSETSSDLSAIPFLTLSYLTQPVLYRGFSKYLSIASENVDSDLFLNFKINSKNDTLYLFNNAQQIKDKLIINNLPTDVSIGRTDNKLDTAYFFLRPSPLQKNIFQKYPSIVVDKPDFSQKGGLYNQPFLLNIDVNDKNSVIRYTLDGSAPDENSLIFDKEILIDKNTCVRAKAYKDLFIPSEIITESFIFLKRKQTLPVISLSFDPDDFFDYHKGIYVLGPNAESEIPHFGANFWQDWEKPANMILFETDGSQGFNENVGVKIAGNWSRANAQKSLAVFMRNKYGSNSLKYQIFKDKPIYEFESFFLRCSGSDFNNSMMRDGMIQSLCRNMKLDRQAYKPAVAYFNGEYWGILNFREKINEHFIASNHNVDPKNVSVIDGSGNVIVGTNENFSNLYNFVSFNEISLPENYERVKQDMDIQNFIDYYNVEIYTVNEDWPGNNMKLWRENSSNGRWRYILWDLDFGFGSWDISKITHDMLSFALEPDGPGWPNPPWSTLLFRKFAENEQFRIDLINSMADRLNSTFRPDSVIMHIDSIAGLIDYEVQFHMNRWDGYYGTFQTAVEEMKYFAQYRPDYVREHYRSKFNLSGTYNLTLTLSESEAGRVHLNSIYVTTFPWNGIYFNDVPITITAIANPGYTFIRWEGAINSTDKTITISPNSDTQLNAVFSFDANKQPDVIITEINYHSSDDFDCGDWIEILNNKSISQDISLWKISNAEGFNTFIFPENTIIPSNSYLVICRDSSKFNRKFSDVVNYMGTLPFNLSSTNETIILRDSSFSVIDHVSYSNAAPWPIKADGYGYSLQLNDIDSDNSQTQNWSSLIVNGTPGENNTILNKDPNRYKIVINEINYNSHKNGNSGDWIELYNGANTSVDLSGWVINDKDLKNIFVIPENTIIESGEYLVFVKSATQFKLIHPTVTRFIETGIGFDNIADKVLLYDNFEELVDNVQYSSSAPWPVFANGTGKTIMLLSEELNNTLAINWTESDLLGTPGRKNSKNTVEIDSIESVSLNVYPTVVNSQFTIIVPSAATVTVVNEFGQKIESFKINGSTTISDINYPEGLYIIYLTSVNETKSFPVIVKK